MSLRAKRIATVIVFALVSWGLLSAEQRPGNPHVPRIGYLGFRPLTESGSIEVVTALREGLRDLGLAEGRDYVLDLRSADNDADRFPALISELTRPQVRLILAPSTPAAVAIHKANPDPQFTLSRRIASETGSDRTTIVSPETERYEVQSRWHSDNDSL